jgi:hypothetical protein
MSISRIISSLTALACALALGCSCDDVPSGSCNSSRDCRSGLICRDNRCTADTRDGGPGDANETPDALEIPDVFVPPVMDAGPCRSVSGESTIVPIPVDIIIAIDNSGSMTAEAMEVQRNINTFAGIIAASGLDYRVVLISNHTGSTGVCVPPPLGTGAPACTGGPEGRLLHIHRSVASRNAPDLVLSQYPMYQSFLRMNSAKVFLWITDDESSMFTADSFRTALRALAPAGMFDIQIHNSIVGYYGDTPATWSTRSAGACGSLARVGSTYMRLAQCLTNANAPIADCTPGSTGRVCESDWTSIFVAIARGVVSGVAVACEFEVPAPPMGQSIDLERVAVSVLTTGGVPERTLTRVENEAACTPNGWYADDPMNPTRILFCTDACRAVQAVPDASVNIDIGCFTDVF